MAMSCRMFRAIFSVFFLVCFAPISFLEHSAFSDVRTKTENAELDKRWLRIGFYTGSLWGGYVSQVSEESYFLAPGGRRNPRAELEATIQAFQAPVTKENLDAEIIEYNADPTSEQKQRSKYAHALCRYPARLEYVLSIRPEIKSKLPQIKCARYENFLRRTNAAKISLVFSSYYLGNPSSAFGHTLLRVHNEKFANAESELLDTAVGFAAFPTVSNPVLYALYGLAGVFPGGFSAEPYYRKVRAYNDQESRDLYSYDLNLKPDEIKRMMNLIWEMGSAYVSYYYFTVNCGTLLMDLIDAAAPRMNLRARIPFYVVPSDVVRAANAEPGLIGKRRYRPSVRRQFELRYYALTKDERDLFWNVVETADAAPVKGKSDETRVRVLDAWADYIEYKSAAEILANEPEASALKQKALTARSEIIFPSTPTNTPPEGKAPELAHDVRQASLGLGRSEKFGAILQTRYRFALHSLTNSDLGLPPNTEITFFELSGLWTLERKPLFYMEDFTLFRVLNLNPWKSYEKPFSFGAGLEMTTSTDPDFNNPLSGTEYVFAGGYGVTIPLWTEKALLFTLMRVRLAAGPDYRTSWWRLNVGPQAGLLLHLSDHTKFLLEATAYYRPNGDDKTFVVGTGELQYSFSESWTTFARFSANKVDQRFLGGFRFLH
jgi:hypothetical protein